MSDSNQQPFGFQTTQWSLVLAAGDRPGRTSNASLEELCKRYWRPLYHFARQHGRTNDEAEDLVQGFFLQILEGNTLAVADRERGRFRTFLLASLTNFLRNQHAKETTRKRGGEIRPLSLDLRDEDGALVNQPTSLNSPEKEFDRQWAITVMGEVMEAIRAKYNARGNISLFDGLAKYLSLDARSDFYSHTAGELGMTPASVKVAVHRLRREYRKELEATVAATVQNIDEIHDELSILLEALSTRG